MDKEHTRYQYTAVLFCHKKGSSATCDSMDDHPGHHTKSERERETETLCDPSVWNLKNQTQRNKSRLAILCVCVWPR